MMDNQLAIKKSVEAEKLLVAAMLQQKLDMQNKLISIKANADKINSQSLTEK